MIYLKILLILSLIFPSSAWCFGVGTVGELGRGKAGPSVEDSSPGIDIGANQNSGIDIGANQK